MEGFARTFFLLFLLGFVLSRQQLEVFVFSNFNLDWFLFGVALSLIRVLLTFCNFISFYRCCIMQPQSFQEPRSTKFCIFFFDIKLYAAAFYAILKINLDMFFDVFFSRENNRLGFLCSRLRNSRSNQLKLPLWRKIYVPNNIFILKTQPANKSNYFPRLKVFGAEIIVMIALDCTTPLRGAFTSLWTRGCR